MNYVKTGTCEWLAHCAGCPVPEVTDAFECACFPFRTVNYEYSVWLDNKPESATIELVMYGDSGNTVFCH